MEKELLTQEQVEFEQELARESQLELFEEEDAYRESTFEERYENAEFAQDGDWHNMGYDNESDTWGTVGFDE